MNVKSVVENKENYEVELIVEVGKDEFEAGLDRAYRKSRGSIQVPGFRKGKAPRKVIEGMYGAGVFYEDAVEDLYPGALEAAIKEKELDSVAPPKVEVIDLGKDGFTFKAVVTVRPVITLKQYKGLEADKVLPTITEEEVDLELKQYVDRATQMIPVERPAAEGDSVVINYQGLKDGEAFDGGSAEHYELPLGSHTFIPGFEEKLVGISAGEEKEIDLTFPEDYHADNLAGQPVVFKVKCLEVKEKSVPEIDDEFAKDVSEFETLAAFRDDLKQKLIDRSMAQSEAKFRQALLAKMCDQVEIAIPEAMKQDTVDRLLENYAMRLEQQGITMEMYCSYMQTTVEKIREELAEPAVTQIKQQLALDAVVAAENIVITDDDVDEEVKKAAANLNMPFERVIEGLDRDGLKADLARDRAMNVVAAEAKPHLIAAEADGGEIQLTEVTKEEAAPAEESEKAPPKKKTTTRKKKTETAKDAEATKPDAAEGAAPPPKKKTTTRKKKTETAKDAKATKSDAAEGAEEKPSKE